MIDKPFSASAGKFIEPTDQEISALAGTPVFSARPEDLPHFEKLRSGEIQEIQTYIRALRLTAIIKKQTGTAPDFIMAGNTANTLSASIHIGYDKNTLLPAYVFMMRPSLQVTAAEHVASSARQPSSVTAHPIPDDELRFIQVQHEIDHIINSLRNRYIPRRDEELSADLAALTKYRDAGGSEENIRLMILSRAVTSFAALAPNYYIAPALHHRLIKKGNDADIPSDHTTWLAYSELAFRNFALLGHSTYIPMDSETVQQALYLNEHDRLEEASERALIPLIRDYEDRQGRLHGSPGIFEALQHSVRTAPLSPFTRACAMQILEGASIFTPGIYTPDAAIKKIFKDFTL